MSTATSIYEKEISALRAHEVIFEEEDSHNISSKLHLSPTWADIFWRRRDSHASRPDPEIPFIFKNHPKNVLEIGSAYGRILRKILEYQSSLDNSPDISGIELCDSFSKYHELYKTANPVLNKAKLEFDDFFTTTKFSPNQFDVIILPMNTFPSFPYQTLDSLFERVLSLLTENGQFIFSTHKYEKVKSLNPGLKHGGTLQFEQSEDIIASEYFNFPLTKRDYGLQIVTYLLYNRFSRKYQLKKREIFRTIEEFIEPPLLKELINKNGFSIQSIDDSSHSSVYILESQ